ncbi:type VI secretion system tip protein VgrG [Burkholderia cenocepacia]|uniref:type VI secretion system Vgr family protein n=1 Tax=Burkholderia cenocepacia TaxID=95486 RepID=UPI002237F1A6|nr:type VI secretion system Vgr family protein [Burkholderia cenocepacia]MCW5115705.1 type VI secretion system tip protein VgrG [Burkholderia cenocepacia]MCW5131905.1 type VI secretion system tip protein VgrG [Burkholderia cenocepacia]MCW5176523.1 type VI secretion system tip protein VgrG [Burkholderia cenocepacia]
MALFDAPRTLSISGAALPMYGDRPILTPVTLTGGETLGELFEYTVELKTPDELGFSQSIAANIDLDKLIGTELTVSIQIEGVGHFIPGLAGNAGMANIGAGTREITGIVTNASILREDGRSIVYAVTLRPWLWLATKNSDCRIFQDMSVIEITDAVLSAYLFPVDKRLTPPRPNKTWPKRDIQRQHHESDWTFLQRLWEEWGIFYFFEHDDGKHRLVLCDAIAALKPHGDAYSTIRYEAPDSRRIDEEHIHALSVSNALTTGAVTSVDYDYTRPRADLTVAREDPRNTGLADQEHYTWGDYAQPQAGTGGLSGAPNEPRTEAEYLTLVQMEAWRCQGLRASGRGNLRGLVTGRTFVLSHYPQSAANCEYAVIAARLTIEEVGEASGSGQRYHCEADFVLQPTYEPFRLLRTIEKPRITGVEYAVVTCPENQEIWTDAYGRVKLQFLWDRLGNNDERSSCWVRVAGAWHGDQFGGIFLPRRGHEVEVAFANGDPDLPIIVGSAVNAFNKPPFALPENQTLAGFRSKEIGARRANTLVFDDTNGKIQAHLSSDEGSSQLNLGYITRIAGNAGRQDERGRGVELRTDGDGVFRAATGMLLTTEGRPNAQGHAKAMSEAIRRLEVAQSLHVAMSQAAQEAQAQETDGHQSDLAKTIEAQNDQIRGVASDGNPFPEFSEPHLMVDGKAGVEITTPATVHVAAQQVALTSEGHVGVASGRSFFASVRDTISLFAQRAAIRISAALGDIVLHALTSSIKLESAKSIQLLTKVIQITGVEKLELQGGKTRMVLDDSGAQIFTPGKFVAFASTHSLPGPKDLPVSLTPKSICIECLLKAARGGSALVPRQ